MTISVNEIKIVISSLAQCFEIASALLRVTRVQQSRATIKTNPVPDIERPFVSPYLSSVRFLATQPSGLALLNYNLKPKLW